MTDGEKYYPIVLTATVIAKGVCALPCKAYMCTHTQIFRKGHTLIISYSENKKNYPFLATRMKTKKGKEILKQQQKNKFTYLNMNT